MPSFMSSRLAEREIEREARRVLRRLAMPRQLLLARRGGDYAVARGPSAVAASRLTVGAEFVQAFLRLDWIQPDGAERFVIAPAGVAFITRSFGGEDGFAAQHRLMQAVTTDEGDRLVQVNAGESPLARLKLRGLVDATQFAAGERLRRDFTMAQLTPRMGVNWEAPVVSGGRGASADHQSDIAIAARQRLNRAMAALGPGLSDLAFDICCHLKTLEEAERGRGWAQRAARVVLKIALDRLAAHYGMGVTRAAAPMRAWHAPEAV
jgi:hypothetical protein